MTITKRDYSLVGPESRRAFDRGLAEAAWWRPPIDDRRLAELMERSDGRAARDTALWLGLIIGLAVVVVVTWFSWFSIPLLIIYGALYGGAADSRWHECGHGTAFRYGPANTVIYYIASFMLWREPTMWRWSHYRHHTDTIIVGRDAEIVFQRPPDVKQLPLTFSNVVNGPKMFWRMGRHALGRIDPDAADFIPQSERKRLIWEDRAFVAITAASAGLSLLLWNPLPILLVGLPTIYGAWLVVFFGLTQHAGLQEDVLDHRLNTRTVYMNPVFRWLYSNMNYHIEHHLFPGVPYYALPALHEELKDSLPPALPNVRAAYRELLGALREQEKDPTFELTDRAIPDVPSSGIDPIDVGPMVRDDLKSGPEADLGPTTAVPVGRARRVDVGGRTYALYRLADDDFVVSDGLCTHGQAHLAEGVILDCTIECPKHNGRFDLRTGGPARKPVTEPVRVYPCEVVEGRVIADLSSTPVDR
ncbi:MAG: fatty acid desaturase [Acidimicrobiales bacterium]